MTVALAPRPEAVQTLTVDPWEALAAAILRRGDSAHTRRAYAGDLRTFAGWLQEVGLPWTAVTRDDLDGYREWLAGRYTRATVNRRLGPVRLLYAEARDRGLLTDDPARRLRSLRGRDDRDGGALTRTEARELLDTISADTARPMRRLIGLRDLALVSLIIRTGLRRSEVAGLRVGDLGSAQGHAVATIRGKGNVLRTVKLPPDLRRTLGEWLEAAGHADDPEAPVFLEVARGGHPSPARLPLSTEAVYRVVRRRLAAAKLPALSPHALRATFVTLALEAGAPLHLVQRAAGHADPRTTERYWRRKASLDDAAVDYIRL